MQKKSYVAMAAVLLSLFLATSAAGLRFRGFNRFSAAPSDYPSYTVGEGVSAGATVAAPGPRPGPYVTPVPRPPIPRPGPGPQPGPYHHPGPGPQPYYRPPNPGPYHHGPGPSPYYRPPMPGPHHGYPPNWYHSPNYYRHDFLPYVINGVVGQMRWVLNPNTGGYELKMPGQWAPQPDGSWVWLPGMWPVAAADRTNAPTVEARPLPYVLPNGTHYWTMGDGGYGPIPYTEAGPIRNTIKRLFPRVRERQGIFKNQPIRRFFRRLIPQPAPSPEPQPEPVPPTPPTPPTPPVPPPKPVVVAAGVYCVVFTDSSAPDPKAAALEDWAEDSLQATGGFKRYDVALLNKEGSPLAGYKPLVDGRPLPVLIVLAVDGKSSKKIYAGPEPKTQADWQKLLDEAADSLKPPVPTPPTPPTPAPTAVGPPAPAPYQDGGRTPIYFVEPPVLQTPAQSPCAGGNCPGGSCGTRQQPATPVWRRGGILQRIR